MEHFVLFRNTILLLSPKYLQLCNVDKNHVLLIHTQKALFIDTEIKPFPDFL